MRQISTFEDVRSLTAEDVIKLQKFILISIFVILSVLLQTILLNARSAPESFADLVEDVGSSVVNITTTTKVAAPVVPRVLYQVVRSNCFVISNPNSPRQRHGMQML